MQENSSSFVVVSVPPFAEELFGAIAQTSVRAAAKLAYYTAFDHIDSGRLTKKFLMSAPAGSYLASNCYVSTATSRAPIFAETVADSHDERLVQWARIKAANADDRLCYLHKSRAAYDQITNLAEFGGVFAKLISA
jgi:hypothetical protein